MGFTLAASGKGRPLLLLTWSIVPDVSSLNLKHTLPFPIPFSYNKKSVAAKVGDGLRPEKTKLR